MFNTIKDIKIANIAAGGNWFKLKSEMRIESELIQHEYFITSEVDCNSIRRYTVRKANDNGDIETHGNYHQYMSKDEAQMSIKV